MDLPFLRRWWPIAGIAALLALAALAAGHSALEFSRIDTGASGDGGLPGDAPPTPVPPSPTPSATRPAEAVQPAQGQLPDWINTVAIVLAALVILVVVGLLLRRLTRDVLRRRTRALVPVDRSAEGTKQEVVAALDAGLIELSDTDADPRTAVIACWVRLEQAAASAGVPRQVGDTPTDLVGRLLRGTAASDVVRPTGPVSAVGRAETAPSGGAGRGLGLAHREGRAVPGSAAGASDGPAIVSADVLAALAHVYREARYATHTVDRRMRDEARSALQRLRAELTAGMTL